MWNMEAKNGGWISKAITDVAMTDDLGVEVEDEITSKWMGKRAAPEINVGWWQKK